VHAHVRRLVSVVKMATVLEECTTEEQRSVMLFLCAQKGSMGRIFVNKCFLFTVGSVCRVKRFATTSRSSLKNVRKSQMMPDQVWKWLRQESKDFYAADFDALLKDGSSASVLVEDMSRNKCFFQVGISHVLRFISICDLFTDSPLYFTRNSIFILFYFYIYTLYEESYTFTS
jgi:hypothetical protein